MTSPSTQKERIRVSHEYEIEYESASGREAVLRQLKGRPLQFSGVGVHGLKKALRVENSGRVEGAA
jgi:hypothetical protein